MMRKTMLIPAAALAVMTCLPVFAAVGSGDSADMRVLRDVPYDVSPGRSGLGDLFLPADADEHTPVVLTIHGGGWSAGDRASWEGVAGFFTRDLGFASFNIEYRLSSVSNRWPACGDDCVAAAKWLLSPAFRKISGIKVGKIWICGGSAGGHLTLWTLVNLPPEKVAGAVSVSSIGDPVPDFRAHPGRYRSLFGADADEAGLAAMNPVLKIKAGMPPVLCTHATGDRVVPVASHRAFSDAYLAAGNVCEFFEYPTDLLKGLTGHCIWIPGSSPHRLIGPIEDRIRKFVLRHDAAAAARSYIPEPKPVKSDIELSALYYPGTEHMPEWDMVRQTLPHIRPLLGWYDEGDPENIDWQIKWAVEHGISSFCVDWYWNCGEQRLDQWVKGFYKARFRRYLKWYLMYANHNAPGAHSSKDQEAVTKWWIENYFRTPEYYKIDGKPVVVYFSTRNLDRDFIDEAARNGEKLGPGEGMRRAFGISERLAREAGLPGIHWMSICGWPEVPADTLARLKTGGIKEVMPYTFGGRRLYDIAPEARKPGDRPKCYSFDVMMAGAEKYWKNNIGLDGIGYLPMLPTGWDDRPRSFQKSNVTHSRTPEKFRKVCASAKEFCRKHGVRRIMIAPINEWQEGSYIEPNDEFGFGMYDAMRDVFCEKPAAGWPANLTPESVGRPLREFPPMHYSRVQSWTFDASTEGWYRQPYGCPVTLCKDGALTFVTTRKDNFNIRLRLVPFAASAYASFSLRMRLRPVKGIDPITGDAARMRLKWGTTDRPVIDASLSVDETRSVASCGVKPDGQWHTYSLDLSGNPDWKGLVDELWFEAVGATHVDVDIDWMKFVPASAGTVSDDAFEKERKRRLDDIGPYIYNTDGCEMFYYPGNQPVSAAAFKALRLDYAKGTKIRTVSYCPVGSFGFFLVPGVGEFNTRSWPSDRDIHGVYPKGAKDISHYNAAEAFDRQLGTDALQMSIDWCRENGCQSFASLRFNDTHDRASTYGSVFFSPFKARHPECLMGSATNQPKVGSWTAVNFAHPTVRERFRVFVRQLFDKYDIDGFEMDFFRHAQVFKSVADGGEASEEELGLMTGLVEYVRNTAEEVGRRRGHPVLVAVRTPDSVGFCRAIGLDVETWLARKLVDIWTVTSYFQLEQWSVPAALAKKHGVRCFASLDESRINRMVKRRGLPVIYGRGTPDNYAARIASALEAGCDGINLFNQEYAFLRKLGEIGPEDLAGRNKTYFAVERGSGGYTPGNYLADAGRFNNMPKLDPGYPLRMKAGSSCSFEILMGEDFAAAAKLGKRPEVTAIALPEENVPVKIEVNGHKVTAFRVAGRNHLFALDPSWIKPGLNAFSVSTESANRLHDFAVKVRYLPAAEAL